MERGMKIVVVAYGGERIRARVWGDLGPGVLICSEEEYRRAIESETEPLYAGFPREDLIEAGRDADAEGWAVDSSGGRGSPH